jgi:Kef-type K+ transport system membrane component KefB
MACVALARRPGLEVLLGAFLAGVMVGADDRDRLMTHPRFRLKLEARGSASSSRFSS